jgi:hypothetical protein
MKTYSFCWKGNRRASEWTCLQVLSSEDGRQPHPVPLRAGEIADLRGTCADVDGNGSGSLLPRGSLPGGYGEEAVMALRK